jgi:hypothetical protein
MLSEADRKWEGVTTFCRLDELGLEAVGQRLEPDRAVLACRVVEPDQWCRRCGCHGTARDTVVRRLAHEPFGWRPTTLLVSVRRYRCTGRGHVWRQDTTKAAQPRAKLSRRGLRWALEALVIRDLTVARVAEALAVSWNAANDAVLAEGQRVLIDDVRRFDGVMLMVAAVVFLAAYAVPILAPDLPSWLLSFCRWPSWITWAIHMTPLGWSRAPVPLRPSD